MAADEPISDGDRVRIVSNFILNAPPGEFKEVLNDVRLLLNNDNLLNDQATSVFSRYIKEQLTPVCLEGSDEPTLITEFNDLGGSRFFDPRTKQSFKYDCIRDEATAQGSWTEDSAAEPWRAALETLWTMYAREHYTNGVSAVFGSSSNGMITLTACVEGHQFQPKNFWNGRWRSVWSTTFNPSSGKAELTGKLQVQVHYYEDGNVQLVTNKEIKEPIVVSGEESTAKEFVSLVKEAENDYQVAISDNYNTMSETTFKALRRALPVTRAKFEWSKLMGYKIGSELKPQ